MMIDLQKQSEDLELILKWLDHKVDFSNGLKLWADDHELECNLKLFRQVPLQNI